MWEVDRSQRFERGAAAFTPPRGAYYPTYRRRYYKSLHTCTQLAPVSPSRSGLYSSETVFNDLQKTYQLVGLYHTYPGC